jgi:hypothetical protein
MRARNSELRDSSLALSCARTQLVALISALALCAATLVHAAETVTYSYDAHGRLTQLQTSGGPANGSTRTYQYDAANNRTSFQVSGGSTGGSVTITPTGAVANASSVGVVIAVNIAGTSPSGMVTFTENGVFLGSAFVYDGQASVLLEGFAMGAHTITATYSGDGINAPSTHTFTIKVQNLSWLPAVLDILLSD